MLTRHVSVPDVAGPEAGPLPGPGSPISGGADLPIGGSRASGKDRAGNGEEPAGAGERGAGQRVQEDARGCTALWLDASSASQA